MNNKSKIIIAIIVLVAAFGAGYYAMPTKTVIKTEIKEVEVIKEVVKESKDIHKDRQIHIIETIFPDGKKTKETFIINKDTIYAERTKFVEVEKTKELKTETSKTRENAQYNVGALAGIDPKLKPSYGVIGQRRLFGNIFGGAYVKTNPEAGVVLSIEF